MPSRIAMLIKARSRFAILLLASFLSACGNDIEKTRIFEPHTLPESTIHNAHIRRSEKGSLQLLMEAPLVCQYSKPEPKTEYPKGIKMRFFNGYNKPTGTLTARYAVSYDKRQETILRDSVVIVDKLVDRHDLRRKAGRAYERQPVSLCSSSESSLKTHDRKSDHRESYAQNGAPFYPAAHKDAEERSEHDIYG